MPHTLREEITIAAPVAYVWDAVHRDIESIPRWSHSLESTEVVGGGEVRRGSQLRYVARLPGGLHQELRLRVTVYELHRRCAGTLQSSVMTGRWAWTYAVDGDVTHVTYETTVQAKGVLRFAGGVIEEQVRRDVRRNFVALRKLVERRAKR